MACPWANHRLIPARARKAETMAFWKVVQNGSVETSRLEKPRK